MGIYTAPTSVATPSTASIFTTNELPVDMTKKMYSAYAPATPLTTILTKMAAGGKATNFRVDLIEQQEIPTTLVVATTESSASTTVYVVSNGATIVAGTLLYNPRTDDLRRVSANATTNTLTVTTSFGGTTSAAWNAGDVLHVTLPAIAENDTTTRNVSVADTNIYNYIQTCKLQFAITYNADAMGTYFGGPGSKLQELMRQKFREYKIKLEKLFWFGGRSSSGTAPATLYSMGGIVRRLRNGTLFKDFNGIMTESGFRNMVGDYLDENPDATEITYFVSGHVADIIASFGMDKVRLDPMSKEFGLEINSYRARGITARYVAMPLFNPGVTGGWGFGLDLSRILDKPLQPDTYFPWDRNRGAGGEIQYHTYLGVHSMLLANESRHQMFVGAQL